MGGGGGTGRRGQGRPGKVRGSLWGRGGVREIIIIVTLKSQHHCYDLVRARRADCQCIVRGQVQRARGTPTRTRQCTVNAVAPFPPPPKPTTSKPSLTAPSQMHTPLPAPSCSANLRPSLRSAPALLPPRPAPDPRWPPPPLFSLPLFSHPPVSPHPPALPPRSRSAQTSC